MRALVALFSLLSIAIPSELRGQTGATDLSSFVSVEGFYTRALGNLSPRFPSASGGYVGYGHYFPDNIVAMIKLGYSEYKLGEGIPSDQKLSAVHVLAGPRYYFMTDGFMPFLFLNVGAILLQPGLMSQASRPTGPARSLHGRSVSAQPCVLSAR